MVVRRPPVIVCFMTVGDGNVIGVPNNRVVYMWFTDDVEFNDTILNCTVTNQDVRTDTIWSVENYKGSAERVLVTKINDPLFTNRDDGHRRNAQTKDFGNLIEIRAAVLKELSNVVFHCGSHINPFQATFEVQMAGEC